MLLLTSPATITPITDSVQDTVANTIELKEVRISVPSKTRMKDGAMITRIMASSLANVGNAEDVLARVPGMMMLQGELQVIGKGAPIYYINGRKVQDITELQRLSSHDIKDVEVINNPGAEYDAQTRAVVKIRTMRQKGEGMGVSADLSDAVAPSCGNNQFGGTIDLNYRYNSLDVFGGATIDAHHLAKYQTLADNQSFTLVDGQLSDFMQTGSTRLSQQYNSLKYNFGFNYQISDDHSLGVRVERCDNLKGKTDFNMVDDILHNGRLVDHLITDTHTDADGLNSWLTNLYYNGKVKQLGIDFNFDFYNTDDRQTMTSVEEAYSGIRNVVSTNEAKNRLFATKLVLTHPLWGGTLKGGTEMTFVKRNSIYDITDETIANDKAEVKENTYAAFIEYARMIPNAGMLNLGVRYEHTDFNYNNLYNSDLNLTRKMDNVFPFASFATRLGDVNTSLSYSIRTHRPSYRMLRNNIEYNNRFTLSTGDPTLKNEIRHEAGINAQWRWLAGSLNFSCQKNGIYDWTYTYGNEGTLMLSWVNLSKPINSVSAFINASPTFGIWRPSYTIGIQKQWLTFELTDPRTATGTRTVSYNKPMFVFNADNTFRLPTHNEDGTGAWQLELNSELTSSAHFGNAELRNWFWNLSCAVQKSFLKNDALSVRLSFSDIFHTAYYNVRLDLGNYMFTQTNILGQARDIYDLQRIKINIRYKFNAVKSKYKGTGAGREMRSRM